MRRIQIYIEDATDDALAIEARRRGISKAALIRESVSSLVPSKPDDDPWEALIGCFSSREPIDDLDAVIYEERA